MEYMVIGEVLKPQGIKGEIKVKPLTDDALRFKKLRTVNIENRPYKILSCRVDSFVYIKLDGIDSRNDAEKLVGKQVRIDRVHSVPLEDDSYFIVDVIGCNIKDENGNLIGKVRAVDNYGAADVITAVDESDKVFRFPFLKKLTLSVDVGKKEMSVYSSELEAVAVYED